MSHRADHPLEVLVGTIISHLVGKKYSHFEGLREAYEAVENENPADVFDRALGWDLVPGDELNRRPDEGFDRLTNSFLGMGSVDDRLWDNRPVAERWHRGPGSGQVYGSSGVLAALHRNDPDRYEAFMPKLENHVITQCVGYAASVAGQVYPNNPDMDRGVVSLAFPKVELDRFSKADAVSIEFPKMDLGARFVDSKNNLLPDYKPFNILEFSLGDDGFPDRAEMEAQVAALYANCPGWAERMTPILDAYFMAVKWPSLSYEEGAFDEFNEFGVGNGYDRKSNLREDEMWKKLYPGYRGFAVNFISNNSYLVRKINWLLQGLDLGEKGSRKNFVIAYKIQQALAKLQEAVGSDKTNNFDALLGKLLNPKEGAVHLQDVEIPFHEADSSSVARVSQDVQDSIGNL